MADMGLPSMAKSGLKQAEMGLLILYGTGYFTNEEWIQIDGLVHKGKYEFTDSPPRHLLDGFDSPLLEANDRKEDSLPSVDEQAIEPIDPIDGKSVGSEEQPSGQNLWDQTQPTESIEPENALPTPNTDSVVSSQVDVTSSIPESNADEIIPTRRQSDTVVDNGESHDGDLVHEQDRAQRWKEDPELVREQAREQTPPKPPVLESKLSKVLRNPSRVLETKFRVLGKPINAIFIAARGFDPIPDMQLKVQPGDHLQIIKYIGKTWYFARNLRTKAFGQFNQDVVQAEPYTRMSGISPAEFRSSAGPSSAVTPSVSSSAGPRKALHIANAFRNDSSLPTDPAILRLSYRPGDTVEALLTARRSVVKDHAERLAIEVGDPIRIQRLLSGITFTGVNLRTEQHGQVHRDVFDVSSLRSVHAPTPSRLGSHDYETEAARDWQDDNSVAGSVRSDPRRSISSAVNMPWRSARISGLQDSVYANAADSRPSARLESPAASTISSQEIERLVNLKVKEALNERSPSGSHAEDFDSPAYYDKSCVICWWWATPNMSCRYSASKCKHLHHYPENGIVAPQPPSKRFKEHRVKKSGKVLTCWFWHNQGHCDNSEENCKFSHRWTGEVADKPFWIKDGKGKRGFESLDASATGSMMGDENGDDYGYGSGYGYGDDEEIDVRREGLFDSEKETPVDDYDEAAAKQKALDEGLHWW